VVIDGDIHAKEKAVLGAILAACGEQLPPHCAEIIANPSEWLSDPRHVWLAGRIGRLMGDGVHVAPQVLLAEDKTGIVAEVSAEGALPLAVAEIEAQTVREYATARLVVGQLVGIPEKLLANPSAAPDVANAVADALRTAFDRASGKKGLTVRSPDEILALPSDPTENLLGARLLTKGGQLVIAGAGGVGKSRLAMQLAVSVIAGRDFLGLPTYGRGLRWLIIQAENDNTRLKTDLAFLRDWLGDDWAFTQTKLRIHTLETERDTMLTLEDETTATSIRRLLDQEKPDVVVWDSLYSFASGDLNKDQDMRASLSRLHQISRHGNPKRAIVVLHHATTGKAGAAKAAGLDRASFGRNSKVLHSWARGQINVAPLSVDDNDLLAVVCGKASNGREFQPFAARLNEGRMIYVLAPEVNVHEAIEDAQAGKNPNRITDQLVADLASGQTLAGLMRAVQTKVGCSRSGAHKAIKRAIGVHMNGLKGGRRDVEGESQRGFPRGLWRGHGVASGGT
jgi:hypothetical protein